MGGSIFQMAYMMPPKRPAHRSASGGHPAIQGHHTWRCSLAIKRRRTSFYLARLIPFLIFLLNHSERGKWGERVGGGGRGGMWYSSS